MDYPFKKIWTNKKVRFSVVTVVYLLWFVIWTENLWWLLGLPFIYDHYFTRYFDKYVGSKYKALRNKYKPVKFVMEWVEALIYAVIVVTPLKLYFFNLYIIPSSSMENTLMVGDYIFVDRLAYGPKMPVTPLSVPFVQHTMPFTENTPSYVDWIQFKAKRLKGYSTPKAGDVVVFNYPEGDTVALIEPTASYYDLVRAYGRERVLANSEIVVRPVDRRENYIKRCVAIAGDTLQVINDSVWLNGVKVVSPPKMIVEPLGELPVTNAVFPHDPLRYPWTHTNYGPIWIPKAGVTVDININNLPLYERIIRNYEGNKLEVINDEIFINGVKTSSYTFAMDYYFMMGDNRDNSLDSRFWGFVPEDHIEGKASFIWLSIAPNKGIFDGIQWNRMFTRIK